jgi:hypothetical protein
MSFFWWAWDKDGDMRNLKKLLPSFLPQRKIVSSKNKFSNVPCKVWKFF